MPPDDSVKNPSPESAPSNDEWNGPWGSIEPVPQSVETLCVRLEPESGAPRIHYFPYRMVSGWTWKMDKPEVLEIQVGILTITISGTGLRKLAEALKLGRLSLVTHSPTSNTGTEIAIRSVKVENSTMAPS